MAIRRNRLDQLLDYWEPQTRRAFLDVVYQMRDQAQISQIVRMLEAGRVEDAIRAVGLDAAQLRPLDQVISNAFEASGQMTAASVPAAYDAEGFRTIFQFNVRNPAAENWLSQSAATMVQQITADQEMMIRETLVDGLSKGLNPRTMALDLVGRVSPSSGVREGGLIGLTSSQAEWVRNYRDELQSENPLQALDRALRDRRFDRTVKQAAESGQGLSQDMIDKMVDSYENRALKFRADSIARTETIHALHEAQQQSIEQAIDAGAIDAGAVGFIWRTADDDRVREIHQVMDGQEVAYGEYFTDGDGNQLEYPGDPNAPPETTINCRCWREPNIDFLKSVVDEETGGQSGGCEQQQQPQETPQEQQPQEQQPQENLQFEDMQKLPLLDVEGVSDTFGETLSRAMEDLPATVTDTLEKYGTQFVIREKLTDAFPELSGVTPRGWPAGTSWDMAEGLYRGGSSKTVAVTEKRLSQYSKEYVETTRAVGVFNHETGHAFDDALGRISATSEFRTAYDTDVRNLPVAMKDRLGYYLQSGSAGPSEAFAETFAHILGAGAGTENLVQLFPNSAAIIRRLMA
jgi:hypothetical protein